MYMSVCVHCGVCGVVVFFWGGGIYEVTPPLCTWCSCFYVGLTVVALPPPLEAQSIQRMKHSNQTEKLSATLVSFAACLLNKRGGGHLLFRITWKWLCDVKWHHIASQPLWHFQDATAPGDTIDQYDFCPFNLCTISNLVQLDSGPSTLRRLMDTGEHGKTQPIIRGSIKY